MAETMAIDLMRWHGLQSYKLQFTDAVREFGRLSYRNRTLSLSLPLVKLNNELEVLDTILHEIAHALTTSHGHDKIWQKTARDIGCNGQRCYGNDVIVPQAAYIGTCPGCQRTIERYRRRRMSCGKCCKNMFNPAYVFEWSKQA
jgi:predicted SprT family Zn-dependent metalloprotease